MLFVIEVHPLALYLAIGFHLHVCLAPFEAVLLINGDEVVEQEGVGTLGTIFWKYTNKQTVYNVGLLAIQSWLGVFQSSMTQIRSSSMNLKYISTYSSICFSDI